MEANDSDHDVDRGSQLVSKPVDVCLMKANNVELTIEEAIQYLGMKNSNNVTSVPPVLPKSGEVYLFMILLNQVASYVVYNIITVFLL